MASAPQVYADPFVELGGEKETFTSKGLLQLIDEWLATAKQCVTLTNLLPALAFIRRRVRMSGKSMVE